MSQAQDLWNIFLKNRNLNTGAADDSSGNTFEDFGAETDALLPNIDAMCETLHDIKDEGKLLVILSHDDTDGIMSGVIGKACLAELGFQNVEMYDSINFYSHPLDKVTEQINKLNEDFGEDNDKYLLICDLNLTSNIIHALGEHWHLLIVDHHIPDAETENDDTATDNGFSPICVNPYILSDPPYPEDHRSLCAATVLWKVLDRYAENYCDEHTMEQIYRFRVFAGIATIADQIDLSHLSRQIVRDSISICRDEIYGGGTIERISQIGGAPEYKTAFRGLFFLLRQFALPSGSEDTLRRAIRSKEDINESLYRGYLAPFLHRRNHGAGIKINSIYSIFGINVFGEEDSGKYGNPIETIQTLLVSGKKHRESIDDAYKKMMPLGGEDESENYIWQLDSAFSTRNLANRKLYDLENENYPHPVLVLWEENGSYYGTARAPHDCKLKTTIEELFPDITCSGHEQAFGISIGDSGDGGAPLDLKKINDKLREQFSSGSVSSESKPHLKDYDFIISLTGGEQDGIYSDPDFREDSRISTVDAEPISLGDQLTEFIDIVDENGPYGAGFSAPEIAVSFRLSEDEWDELRKAESSLSQNTEGEVPSPEQSEEEKDKNLPLRYSIPLNQYRLDIRWYGHEIAEIGSGDSRTVQISGRLRKNRDRLVLTGYSPILIL